MASDPVTIGIVNFNGMDCLPATLDAIGRLADPVAETIVVDNASTDGSGAWLAESRADVRCIALDENVGLPGARNVLLDAAQTDRILIIDNDIVLEPGTPAKLVAVMDAEPDIAVCHPEIVDVDDPRLSAHYNGGSIHYLCAHIARKAPAASRPDYERFDVVSGGALLIDRRIARELGGFDQHFFFNWEDGDFTARATLAGHRCVNVPAAVAFHRHAPRGATRVFHQVRNRWYFILKLYSWRTILLISPMLVVFEALQAGLMLLKGSGGDYLRGNVAVVRTLARTLRKRRRFQAKKILRDRDWLQAGEMFTTADFMGNPLLVRLKRLYNRLADGYWVLVRPFC